MKRKLLWIVIALVAGDIAFVGNARASRSAAAIRRTAAVETAPLSAEQFYPMMDVTVLTPVALPDRVLAPGQYTFTLVYDGRNVSVTAADGKFIGTYMVVPAYRRDAGDGLVETQDAPSGGFDRISTWFFPNQQDGYSFLYPAS